MINIIPFKKEQLAGTGPAFCISCNYKWEANVELPTKEFIQCPKCKTFKALLKFPFQPDITRECNCGNQLFFLTPEGHLCPNCGNYQHYE